MTSVQNHLPRLSGNNIILFLLCCVLLSSCDFTKNTYDKYTKKEERRKTRTKKRPRTKTNTRPKTKPKSNDGVKVIKIPTNNTDQNTKDEIPVPVNVDPVDAYKESSYEVTMLLPLDSRAGAISSSNERFMMYYAGAKIAGDKLREMGYNMSISVADTKNSSIDNVLKNATDSETDVIIGPYDRNDLKYTIDFAGRKKIALVSPWQSLSSLKSENPHYIQLSPSLKVYYEKMVKNISDTYLPGDVTIITKSGDNASRKRGKGIQGLAKAYYRTADRAPFNELLLSESSLNDEDPVIKTLHEGDPRKPVVFILPNWSGRDYSFIYNTLRRIVLEKGEREVIVYGMFSILDNENIDYDLYKALNMRIVTSKYVDQADYDVKRFKRDFLSLYGELPSADAYEGYDNLMYIGRALNKYGKNFQYHLEKEEGYMLQTAYNVTQKYLTKEPRSRNENIQFFENKHLDIIEFKNGSFTRIKK